jgi:glyoxylase-like metal-dependent hydrolase (beta-lactamase superfamily II)
MINNQELIQLSNNVWIYPFDKGVQPSVGIITTNSETVLIDSGNSPQKAEEIKTLLRNIEAPPVKYIIYTHHHWDHTFGGLAFNTTFVSHQKCYEYLKEYSMIEWSRGYLEKEIIREPLLESSHRNKMKLIEDWSNFRIKLPDITFDDTMKIYLDGVTLDLSYIGGNHANDSVVIHVVESNILFVGDCFYPPPLHLRTKNDTYSLDILKELYDFSTDIYIHGHGEPTTLNKLKEFIEHMEQSKK